MSALSNYYREDETVMARVEGRNAFERGEPRSSNPHDNHFGAGHEMWAWYRGWDYAQEAARKQDSAA